MSRVRRLARLSLVALGLSAAMFAAAFAGEIVDAAQQAESHEAAGNPVKALAAIENAFNALWDKAPLQFSEALFVSGKPQGFGIYEPRPTSVFKPGEDMPVYAEPFGYGGYGRKGDAFVISFDADFELRTASGQNPPCPQGLRSPRNDLAAAEQGVSGFHQLQFPRPQARRLCVGDDTARPKLAEVRHVRAAVHHRGALIPRECMRPWRASVRRRTATGRASPI